MTTPVTPKLAAGIVLLRQSSVTGWEFFWARRSNKMPFMSGFHAFPGGRLDTSDAELTIEHAPSPEQAALCACAIREAFEEAAILISPDAHKLTVEERLTARAALMQDQLTFAEFVNRHSLRLDARLLVPAGRWVTPPYAARRFDTWFYTAEIPEGQEPELWTDELEHGTWATPLEAERRWADLQVLLAPPTLHTIRGIGRWIETGAGETRDWGHLTRLLTNIPEANGKPIEWIETRPGIFVFPVRTPTLPPATHTNCYLIGDQELIVIDPASPYADEQARLDAHLAGLQERTGARVREIWLTHHHPDHVSGVEHARTTWGVPVAAHPKTAELLKGKVTVDRFLNDGDVLELSGNPGWRLRAVFTPGHAPGHLCFLEENSRAIVTGDMVVGLGSVLIAPPDGNMQLYLDSLEKLSKLSLTMILGGHGQAMGSPQKHIASYIKHRLDREAQILEAMTTGAETIDDIVKIAYATTPVEMHPYAALSVKAHLEKLLNEQRITPIGEARWQVAG